MNHPSQVFLGTRSSPLSLIQTEDVLHRLRNSFPNIEFILVESTTLGDRSKEAPIESMQRGMFSSDISDAVLNRKLDCALHSAKDLPIKSKPNLKIVAVTKRSDPRDILITKWNLPIDEIPPGARLGTSSIRRKVQIQKIRPDIKMIPIRGNVGTRIEKAMNSSEYDGVILAAAGIIRLGLQDKIDQFLPVELCTPDVGQGTLVIESRKDNPSIEKIVSKITHQDSLLALTAERSFVTEIGSDCSTPHAAFAEVNQDSIVMKVMTGSENNDQVFRATISCSIDRPEMAGTIAIKALLAKGACILPSRETNG